MSKPICRDFLRGTCRYGNNCKFLHEIQNNPVEVEVQKNDDPLETFIAQSSKTKNNHSEKKNKCPTTTPKRPTTKTTTTQT